MSPFPRSRHPSSQTCRGFTLIELIVVVAIIGVLTAIALPNFVTYRASAFDARAVHDLGNAVTAQEAHYATTETYATFTAVGPTVINVPGLVVSDTVSIDAVGDVMSFSATATSSQGSGKVYSFDSLTDPDVAN